MHTHRHAGSLPFRVGFFAMSSWGTADVVKEITDVADLLRARRQATPQGGSAAGIAAAMVGNVVHKIKNAGAFDAAELYRCIATHGGVFDAEHKDMLSAAVDERVQAGAGPTATGSAVKVTRVPQSLQSLQYYLTEAEWAEVHSCQQVRALTAVVRRLKLLGIVSLKEATKKHVAAVIAHETMQGGRLPTPTEYYGLVQRLLAAFTADTTQTPPGVTPLLHYPARPQDMPEAAFKAAYSSGPPVARELPHLHMLLSNPVRNTHASLRDTPLGRTNGLQNQPSGSLGAVAETDQERLLQVLLQGFQQVMQPRPDPEPRVQFLPRKPSKLHNVPLSLAAAPLEDRHGLPANSLPAPGLPPPQGPLHAAAEAEPDAAEGAQTERPGPGTSAGVGHSPQQKPACSDPDAQEAQPHSLAAYEQAAFDKLVGRKDAKPDAKGKAKVYKAAAKGRAPCKPCKKPASKQQTPAAAARPKPKAADKTKKLGCKKCRGLSCAVCLNPAFNGQRMTRQEWLAWNGQ